MHEMTPEDRVKYLCRALGWQGGTVHQLAKVTGCSVQELLYGDFPAEYSYDYAVGFFWDSNTKEWQDKHTIPNAKGNLFYLFGVMRKMEILEKNCGEIYNRNSIA